jgi:hypothetical protein
LKSGALWGDQQPKTHAAYSTALAYFRELRGKLNLEDIEKKDLLKYAALLRDDKDQCPRSVANKFGNLMVFLKSQGCGHRSRRHRQRL